MGIDGDRDQRPDGAVWLRLTAIVIGIAILLVAGLASLSLWKFRSFLADSVEERLEIVAATSTRDLTGAIDVGLALQSIGNGTEILEQQRAHDPGIRSIVVFDSDGAILHLVGDRSGDEVDDATLAGFQAAAAGDSDFTWTVDDGERIAAGMVIRGPFGTAVGGVMAEYPADELRGPHRAMARDLVIIAVVASIVVALLVATTTTRLRRRHGQRLDIDVTLEGPVGDEAEWADRRGAIAVDGVIRRVMVALSAVLLVAVGLLGLVIVREVTRGLGPELDRRAAQIGRTITDDVAHAVNIGIPVDRLVGVDEYLETFLEQFDEVDHLALEHTDGRQLSEVGAPDGTVRHSFPIGSRGEIGTLELGVDRFFVASRLRDLALDVLVLLVVALVVLHEATMTVTRRIVSGSGAQADGRSPGRLGGHASDIRLVLFLFAVAEELSKSFLPIFIAAADSPLTGVSPAVVISLPFVAYLATLAVVAPTAGQLLRRVGQRQLFMLGLAVAAVTHTGMYLATDVIEIIGLRAATGVGYALATIACQEYLLSRMAPGQRTRAVGVFVSVIIGGTFAGTALGGILADRLGQRAVFLVGASLIVVVALLALRVLDRAGPGLTQPDPVRPADVRGVLRNREFVAMLGGVTVPMNVLTAAFLWYLVPLGMDEVGSTPSGIARALMTYYLAIRLAGPALARRADLRGSHRALVGWGSVLGGAALLLPAIVPSATTFTLAVLGLGLGHAAVRGPQITHALDLSREANALGSRSATLAVVRFVERSGSLVGLLLVAGVVALVGQGFAIGSMSVVATIAAVPFLVASRRKAVTRA